MKKIIITIFTLLIILNGSQNSILAHEDELIIEDSSTSVN